MDVFRVKEGKDYDTKLKLPRNLCHESEFLSPLFLNCGWNSLTDEQKLRLKNFLPTLEGQDDQEFQDETLSQLFKGSDFKFGNPVHQLKSKLINGKFSLSSDYKKNIVDKYRQRKRKLTLVSQQFANLNHVQSKPSLSHEVKRLSRHAAKKLKTLNLDERVGKRHITELRRIRMEVQEKGDSSDDEDFIQQLMQERDRKVNQLKILQDQLQSKANKISYDNLPPLEEIETGKEVTLEERPAAMTTTQVPSVPAPVSELPESSFFSLLKYFFCQLESQSLTIPDLSEAVSQWERSAGGNVTWRSHCQSWTQEIPSAVAFLCGAFPHAQPPGFNPLIVGDANTGLYTWTQSTFTNDLQLTGLTQWWMERRQLCQAITTSPEKEALKEFHAQERIRFMERPNQPFVYKLQESEIQVGPVQPAPDSYAADLVMQNLVTDPRITFYALVQDALGRLKNGRGSLEDISKLIKESQFLMANVEIPTLLKKTALALTHFQKGQMLPFVAFDPNTRQYVIQHQPVSRPDQVRQPAPAQQRNVSHLVQVRTPQGLKLYRLASPPGSMQASQQPQRMIMSSRTPQAAVEQGNSSPSEDTVIVKNSDGRYVQMPRSILKKLISSGQLKQSSSTGQGAAGTPQVTGVPASQVDPPPLAPRITSNDVLNMLPTVPVRQEHLQHE